MAEQQDLDEQQVLNSAGRHESAIGDRRGRQLCDQGVSAASQRRKVQEKIQHPKPIERERQIAWRTADYGPLRLVCSILLQHRSIQVVQCGERRRNSSGLGRRRSNLAGLQE